MESRLKQCEMAMEKSRTQIFATSISTLALAVSILSAVFSYRLQDSDNRRAGREQINKTIGELIQINARSYSLNSTPIPERSTLYYQEIGSLSQIGIALSRQAVFLANENPELMTDIEYITIAQGLVIAGDYDLADEYYRRSIASSQNDFYRILNLRPYASFLFNQGQQEAGRDHYERALKIFKNDTDFNKYTNGMTHQWWMVSENMNQVQDEAEKHYRNAKTLFGSVSSAFMRDSGLAGLESSRSSEYWQPSGPTGQGAGSVEMPD